LSDSGDGARATTVTRNNAAYPDGGAMVLEFFMPLPSLRTRRLRLRGATAADKASLWMLWNVPDVRRYLFDDRPVTRQYAAAVLESTFAQAMRGLGLWMVERAADRTAIGCVALMPDALVADYDPGVKGLVEPIVSLMPPAWGRGYARGDRLCVQHAATAAANDVPDEASHRMLCHLGFTAARVCAGPCHPIRTYRLDVAAFATATTDKLLSPARGRRAT
jgi:hypothetical protein